MGYTLVAVWEPPAFNAWEEMLHEASLFPNKIPFGRKCDREEANQILPYHMTLFHWGKEKDGIYLPRVKGIKFSPCRLMVTGCEVMAAKEGSSLLCLKVQPGEGYSPMCAEVEEALHAKTSSFLHITLAVSKNREEILKIRNKTREFFRFPFRLTVSSLELYHIWKPVYLADRLSVCDIQ